MPPPNDFGTTPIVHKASEWYKKIYIFSSKVSKKDRYGIYLKIETGGLEVIELFLTAALVEKEEKKHPLKNARLKIEMLKRLMRLCYELGIIERKKYIELEYDLVELSRMANGWMRYLQQESSVKNSL